MGICGLHQAIKPYLLPISVAKYAGQRVACDAYAWLHRGACQCAGQSVEAASPELPPYVNFCLKMLAMLQHHKVTPVVSCQHATQQTLHYHCIAVYFDRQFRAQRRKAPDSFCSAALWCRWSLMVQACQPSRGCRQPGEPKKQQHWHR